MRDGTGASVNRLLNPAETVSGILFGLVMVFTITCSFLNNELD